jgi:hypothetical protein
MIGACYNAQKNYTNARDYYLRSLTIREEVLGKNHAATKKAWTALKP